LCGAGADWNEEIVDLEVELEHADETLRIGFSSSLDEGATNESWGLRNFILYIDVNPNDDCAILYDDCGFSGNSIKICGSVPNLEESGFSNNIYSVFVPDGYLLKLFDGSDYKGCVETFTQPVECFENPLHFQMMSYSFDYMPELKLRRPNLRGQSRLRM